jgi:hypothetical protein
MPEQGAMTMYGNNALCKKITQLYPEIGECGMDINVTYDEAEKSWVVHLKKGTHALDHFLDLKDADTCMEGKQCVALGLEIAQLRNNIEGKQY